MTNIPLQIAVVYTTIADFVDRGLSVEDLAGFDVEETLVSLETGLQAIGHHKDRIGNLFHLTRALVNGAYRSWGLVFEVAEGQYSSAREAQVPALLEAYQIPCIFFDTKTLAMVHAIGLTKIAAASWQSDCNVDHRIPSGRLYRRARRISMASTPWPGRDQFTS